MFVYSKCAVFWVLEFRAYDRYMLVVLFRHQGVCLLFVFYKHSLIATVGSKLHFMLYNIVSLHMCFMFFVC